MFCPRCGTENGSEQGYCRQCGLPLAAVVLAADGRVEEARGTLKRGAGNLSGGVIILAIGFLNALANGYFAAWQSAIFSAALGTAVGVPLIAAGVARVRSAKRLLSPGEGAKALPGAGEAKRDLPPPGADAGAPEPVQPAHGSVAEHTTLRLDSPDTPGRK